MSSSIKCQRRLLHDKLSSILSQNQLGHESDHYKFTKSFKYYFIVPTGHLHINFISKSSILMKTVKDRCFS